MEIIDKNGYLESALVYIEKNIISGRGLQKIARKTGVEKDLLSNLSLALKSFSEKQFFTALQEKIEDRHSSLSGADAEISAVKISIECEKKTAYILLNLACDIVTDGEFEDNIRIDAKIFSQNKIVIS